MGEDEFVALRLDNSHNFYARKHEISEEQQKKQMELEKESRKNSDDSTKNNLIQEPVVYDKFYDDCILIRADK